MSYSDADAASPRFTVTDIISIGRVRFGIWNQARELVIMSEPKSKGALPLPANKVTQGDIPLGLMQTSLCNRLSRVPHGRHIKEERQEIEMGSFSLDGRSHHTGDAAFTPATPHDSHHSRANTDSQNVHNTQRTKVKQNKLCFMQKDTEHSQTCSGGHATPNPTQNRCG